MSCCKIMMNFIFSKAFTRAACVDIMARKGNDEPVGYLSTCATGYILCIEKPQSFLKMGNDRTGSVPDICSRLLSQLIAIDERFFWLSIGQYQSIPIN